MPFISFCRDFLPPLIKNYFLRSTIINSNIYCKKIQLFKTVIIYFTIFSFFSCNSTTNNSSTKVIDEVELLRGYFRKNYPIKLNNRIDRINEYHFLLRNEKLKFNLIVYTIELSKKLMTQFIGDFAHALHQFGAIFFSQDTGITGIEFLQALF